MDLGRLYFALRYDQHRYGEKLLKSNPYKSFAQDMSCRSFSIIYLCICFYHSSLRASEWDTLVGFCSATKCMAGFLRMPSHARLVWEFAWRFNTVSIDMHTQTSPYMHLLALLHLIFFKLNSAPAMESNLEIFCLIIPRTTDIFSILNFLLAL